MAEKAKNPAKKSRLLGFGRSFGRFFSDVKGEFKKIVWPTKKQAINNTLVVGGFAIATGVIVWSLDFILTAGVQFFKVS